MYVTRASVAPQRLALFARDFAVAYGAFVDRFPDPATITVDDFRRLFDEQQLEYLHFCGATTLGTVWHDVVVHDVLQLSSAYLYLPRDVAQPHVRVFGLLLCYMLFATQPLAGNATQLPLMQVGIAIDVMEQLMHRLPRSLRSDASAACTSAASAAHCASDGAVLCDAEVHALVSLHSAQAWRLQPFVDVGPHVVALLHAHHAAHASLLTTQATSSSLSAPTLSSLQTAERTMHTLSTSSSGANDVHGDDDDECVTESAPDRSLAHLLHDYAQLKARAHM